MSSGARATVDAHALGDLGADVESATWLMVSTRYHQLYYQASVDKTMLAEVYQVIDNLSEIVSRRSPVNARRPIRVFLVPGERGHSRIAPQAVAMRTGANGDAAFIVASLLHEETHLFNIAFLNKRAQGWWTGEFSCIYHQERARLTKSGVDVKSELARRRRCSVRRLARTSSCLTASGAPISDGRKPATDGAEHGRNYGVWLTSKSPARAPARRRQPGLRTSSHCAP